MYPRFLQFGTFVISTWGILALVAAGCGVALWTSIARRMALNVAKIQNAGLIVVVFAVVGARLAVAIENWRGFLEAPLLILATGTMRSGSAEAFGAALAAVACIVYLLWARVPVWRALDAAAPAAALVAGILDIGDFAAGTHYGAPTTLPWAATYSSHFAARTAGVPLGIPLHPIQIYSAMVHFTLAVILVGMLRQQRRRGEVLGLALLAEGVLRFLLAPLSGDYADAAVLFQAVTTEQAFAMLLVVLGAACWLLPASRTELQHA